MGLKIFLSWLLAEYSRKTVLKYYILKEIIRPFKNYVCVPFFAVREKSE